MAGDAEAPTSTRAPGDGAPERGAAERPGAASGPVGPVGPTPSPAPAAAPTPVDPAEPPATGPAGTGLGRVVAAAPWVLGLVVLASTVVGLAGGWRPVGDDAFYAIRSWDVLGGHVPLLGTASSASETARPINHPGPLQFGLLAAPVRLLGHTAGAAWGSAAINVVVLALTGWLARRRPGPAGAALVLAAAGLLMFSMGDTALFDPWGPVAVTLPFLCVLVATWTALAGDDVAAPIAVVAGALCLQTHLSYGVLVPALGVVAVGATLWRGRTRRSAYAWAGGAVAVGLVCWVPPLVEQFGGGGAGNLESLADLGGEATARPTFAVALRALGEVVALPPAWLGTGYQHPRVSVDPPPGLAAAGPPLALLVALLAGLGWRARRRGSPAAAGCAVALVGLVAGLVSILRMPLALGIPFHQMAWAWPLGAVAWAAVAVALADEASARRPAAGRWVAGGAVAVALAAALLVVPLRSHEDEYADWAMPALDTVSRPVLDALGEADGPVLLVLPYSEGALAVGPGLMTELQATGTEFRVEDPFLVRHLGAPRRYEGPGDATWALTVVGGPPGPGPAVGDARVAGYDADDGDPNHQVEVYVRRLT